MPIALPIIRRRVIGAVAHVLRAGEGCIVQPTCFRERECLHVDDVAAGHSAALQKGRIGERYILGGQNVPLGDMLGEIARFVGRSPPKLRLPRLLIFPIAYGAEAIAHFTGREPFVSTTGLRLAKDLMFFSSAKAEHELGYRARPYAEAIAEAITWFRQNGYLK